MITKNYLRDYRTYKLKYKALKELDKELELSIQSVKAQQITDMPKGHVQNDIMTDNLAKLEESRAKVANAMDLYTDMEKIILPAIESLEPLQYAAMTYYYVLGYTWEQVAIKMQYSYDRVMDFHSLALEALKNYPSES